MNSNISKKQKKLAILFSILLVIMIIFSIISIIYFKKMQKDCNIAYIYQNGNLIHTIPLDKNTAPYQIRIDGPKNTYNIIEINSGKIGIIDANCPDHVCIDMGFHSNSIFPITCLPNGIVISFSTKKDSFTTPDMITY